MDGVDYPEVATLRERGNSCRLSIGVARDVYYRPGTSRSEAVEWEKTARISGQGSGRKDGAHLNLAV